MTATACQPEGSGVKRAALDASGPTPGADDHCVFECGAQVFATNLGAVREVLGGKLATSVPQAPPALVGVVELHGDVLPVLQLSTLTGIAARPYTPVDAIVVLSSRDVRIGIAVDRVLPVRTIDPASLTTSRNDLYKGWYAGTTPPIAVLNADALVAHAVRTVVAHLKSAPLDPAYRRSRPDDGGPVGSR